MPLVKIWSILLLEKYVVILHCGSGWTGGFYISDCKKNVKFRICYTLALFGIPLLYGSIY
jgi:hypothetical protein